MLGRIFLSVLCGLALGSCSSVYDLRAFQIDGRVAFEPVKRDYYWGWGDGIPECVEYIWVRRVSGDAPAMTSEDGVAALRGEVLWSRSDDRGSCANKFPITYGVWAGDPSGEIAGYSSVSATPLAAGETYIVETVSPGSASGSVRFKVTSDGNIATVE